MFAEFKILFLILHLFGVAIGAGGAYMSDAMFFHSIKDRKFSDADLGFMKLGSKMVWAGLGLLVLSGTLMFLGDPERYMNSTKFLVKMTIVAVIIANGIFFHMSHIPRFRRNTNIDLSTSPEFMAKWPLLLISGVISVTSWSSAIILGVMRSVPYSYGTMMAIYLAIIAGGAVVAFVIKDRILPPRQAPESPENAVVGRN